MMQMQSMAATLSLLKLPLLPKNSHQSAAPKLTNPSISAKLTTPKDFFPNPQNLIDQNIDRLKSASLSLSAVTVPFLIHPQAKTVLPKFCWVFSLSCNGYLSFLIFFWEFSFLDRMRLLLVGNLGSWKEEHLP